MSNSHINVTIHSTLLSQWLPHTINRLDTGMADLATDVHRRATIIAPKDTRALVNSGQIVRTGLGRYKIIFGSSQVPYARLRHYRNQRNPGSVRYLEKAGDSIFAGNTTHYFV